MHSSWCRAAGCSRTAGYGQVCSYRTMLYVEGEDVWCLFFLLSWRGAPQLSSAMDIVATVGLRECATYLMLLILRLDALVCMSARCTGPVRHLVCGALKNDKILFCSRVGRLDSQKGKGAGYCRKHKGKMDHDVRHPRCRAAGCSTGLRKKA